MRTRICISCLCVLAAVALPTNSFCEPILPSDANLLVMGESAIEGLSLIGGFAGPNLGSPLNWSGTFDDTGWQWILNGTYNNQPISLAYNGKFQPAGTLNPTSDAITWSGSGNLGAGTFSANGTVILTDDWDWKSIAIGTIVVVADVAIVGAEVWTAAPTAGGSAAASIKAITTVTTLGAAAIAGQDIVTKICKSPCTLEGSSFYDPVDPTGLPVKVPIIVNLTSGDIVGNSVSGQATVAAVPEPATASQMALAAACMAVYFRSRRGQRRRG